MPWLNPRQSRPKKKGNNNMITFKVRIDDINPKHVHFRLWVGSGLRYTHASPVVETICMTLEEFQAFCIRLVAYVYIEDKKKFKSKEDKGLLKSLRLNIYDHYSPAEARPWFAQFKERLEYKLGEKVIKVGDKKVTQKVTSDGISQLTEKTK